MLENRCAQIKFHGESKACIRTKPSLKSAKKSLKMKIKHVEEGSWDETMKTNSDLQPKVQKMVMLPL